MRLIEKVARFKPGEMILVNLERIAAKTGIEEEKLIELYITVKNAAHKQKFVSTPYTNRVLLLPQCLRSKNCSAELGAYGYSCSRCGKCTIKKILEEAEDLGYQGTYILSGGRLVEKIFRKLMPKACVGVGCINELLLGSFVAEKFNVVGQAVKLKRDGCVNSDVDWNSVRDTLHLISPSL
jgi:hypothetical protein